jgi:LysM repeat protein
LSWKTLPVERTERQENTVVRHTVQAGDTVWQIAAANNVSLAAVVTENSLPNEGNSITVGQVLTITKNGTVSTIKSPVLPDPTIVLMGSSSDQSAPPSSSDTAPSSPPTESTPAPTPDQSIDLSSFPALEPLVVRNSQSTSDYVVRRGDTLFRIARANRTTVSALVSSNSLANASRIFVGQRLRIPSGATTQQSFHRVQAGDNLTIIGLRRSIALTELQRLNPGVSATGDLRDGSLIRIG